MPGAKGGWRLLWKTFMQELAPQSKDGDYSRPSYNLRHAIGDPDFPVSSPGSDCREQPECLSARRYAGPELYWRPARTSSATGNAPHMSAVCQWRQGVARPDGAAQQKSHKRRARESVI